MINLHIQAETVSQLKQQLSELLESYGNNVTSTGEVKISTPEEKPKKAKKKAEPEKADDPKQEPTPEVEETTSGVTYDQVKEMALQKARAKKKEEVKSILADAGVVRISDLKESQYAEVYEKLESL